MSWSKFAGTLRFRIALWFTFLFAILLIPAALVFYRTLEHELLMLTDFNLSGTMRQLRFEYLTGIKVSRSEQEIPLEMLPPRVIPEILKKNPDFTPILAFQTPSGIQGTYLYTVVGTRNGNYYEMRNAHSGEIYSRMLNPGGNIKLLQRAFEARASHELYDSVFYRLLAPNGRILAGTPVSYLEPLPPPSHGEIGNFQYYTVSSMDCLFRILRMKLYDGNVLEIGRSLNQQEKKLEKDLLISIFYAVLFLLVGGIAAYLIAARSVRGINRISAAAKRIAEGDFSGRLELAGEGSEIDQLSAAFNHMTENTEHLVVELKNVTDNIAHDLRTPLTRIRGIADVTVNGPQDLSHYKEMAGTVAEECSSMVRMINTMLEITRTEGGREKLDIQNVDLNQTFQRAGDLFQVLFDEKQMIFHLILPDNPVLVPCDRMKIQRVISNLLDNAIKFSTPGTSVTLTLSTDKKDAIITVSDQGCGIEEKDRKQLFKRFFRSDSSRTLPGNGLGLSLVHAIILAHRGTIGVESESGRGTTIRFTLPI